MAILPRARALSFLKDPLRNAIRRQAAGPLAAGARASSSGGGSESGSRRRAFAVTAGAAAFGACWFWRDNLAYSEAGKSTTLQGAGLSRWSPAHTLWASRREQTSGTSSAQLAAWAVA